MHLNTSNQLPTAMDQSEFIDWCQQLIFEPSLFERSLFEACAVLINQQVDSSPQSLQKIYHQSFETALILSELRVDSHTLVAAIIYPFIDQAELSLEVVADACGSKVLGKIKGVITMDAVRGLQQVQFNGNEYSQADNLRKMLLAMVDDVTVVLIKLAERLYQLRNAKSKSESIKKTIALEVKDVYAPLANRLGVGHIKWEMEDLAFRFLKPKDYAQIANYLSEKRLAREKQVESVLEIIKKSLDQLNIKSELMGRAKHIYSIWKKMQRKQVGFEEIYDVRAVRVLVPKIQDCYSVLGVVHGQWKHIPKEFDDYIATPKENGYRSLHTAVIGPDGKTLEIQIRTHEMHQESELGVAAHWKYKEGAGTIADGYEAKIAWLRQLLDWQDELADSGQLIEEFKSQVFDERIYVFTPMGKLIDLPAGSTALDFAYRVHTDIGHRCRGAKANGRIISLTQALETGQRIEILTTKTGGPSRDWLSEQQGYLKSTRARNKVHQWFKHQDKDKNIVAGKSILEKEIRKNGLEISDFIALAKHFNFNTSEELYAAIGAGDKGIHQVMNACLSIFKQQPDINRQTVLKRTPNVTKRSSSSDILVEGVGNLLTRMAACCKPVPGDEISGFVTQSRGSVVHRSDCRYLLNNKERSPQKVLEVSWTQQVNQLYLIDLSIESYDRKGLLSDITALLSKEKISLTSLNTQVNKKDLQVKIKMQIEISNLSNVSRIINLIEQVSHVISVIRN